MHSKKLSRWLKLLVTSLGLTALIGVSISLPSEAVSPTPVPYCTDGTCWVFFEYTGDYSYWTPPSGINSLHFDVYGAQGGRSGGKGGYVNGDFATIPSALYIYVGGAGGSGNSTAGGFNGGGNAGSGHADQGSGGGASDIRTSTVAADRIVVAGGGGGTGGWIGGAGGAGGMTIATPGTKGATATTAGGAGSQTAGGTAGLGVTTGNGTAGALSQGGNGGTGTVAGGGGGGGGFYGGGGGGSDNLAGGSDGAGGGGGSSFATMALTTNVTHLGGSRLGNGQVVLRYTFAPKVTSLYPTGGSTSSASTIDYQLSFDQYVWDVDPWDFIFSGTATGCYGSSVTGDGYVFDVKIAGCSSGTLLLSLRANSINGSTSGPAQEVLASGVVTVDATPAVLRLSTPASPTNSPDIVFNLIAEEPIATPNNSAFTVTGSGCSIGNITMLNNSTSRISVVGCANSANVRLTLNRNSIRDLVGNPGPASDITSGDVLVDYESPSLVGITTANPVADTSDYTVTFSEPVSNFSTDSLNLTGAGCVFSKLEGAETTYHVYVTGCTAPSSLTVRAMSVKDAAGNNGPIVGQTISGSQIDVTAPSATVLELERHDKTLSPSFEIHFDELVSGFTINTLSRSGTAKGCSFTVSEILAGRVYHLDTAGCEPGSLTVTLLANSVMDTHGNVGPITNVDSLPSRIAAPSTLPIAHPAKLASTPVSSGHRLHQMTATGSPTQPVVQVAKPSKATAPATQPIPATGFALAPESWVSIGIALLALAIAKRPRGRRRALVIRR